MNPDACLSAGLGARSLPFPARTRIGPVAEWDFAPGSAWPTRSRTPDHPVLGRVRRAADRLVAIRTRLGVGRWRSCGHHWQTLVAGGFALLAGVGTVVATMIITRRQIAASREEADRVIATTREQTARAEANRNNRSFGRDAKWEPSPRISHHAQRGDGASPRRGGLGQKDLSAHFGVGNRRVCRGPCRSQVHHQRRVRGIAGRLRQAGQPLDWRVSRP